MDKKRFSIAVVLVLVAVFVTEFIINRVFLSSLYRPYTAGPTLVFRGLDLFMGPDGKGRAHLWAFHTAIYVAQFLFAFFFTYVFTRGVEGKGWLGEGLRYGFIVWGLAFLPNYLGQYSWSQMPGTILMWWTVTSFFECLIWGCVCAACYKKVPAVA